MGKALSTDLRERIVGFIEEGHGLREASRRFKVSASSVIRLASRIKRTGTCVPERQGRPRGSGKLAPFSEFLTSHVDQQPDITMPELSQILYETHGVEVTPAALSRFLIRVGYSYKKNAAGNGTRTRAHPSGASPVDHATPTLHVRSPASACIPR